MIFGRRLNKSRVDDKTRTRRKALVPIDEISIGTKENDNEIFISLNPKQRWIPVQGGINYIIIRRGVVTLMLDKEYASEYFRWERIWE